MAPRTYQVRKSRPFSVLKSGRIDSSNADAVKSEIEKYRKWFFKNEGELLESDYTPADLLEYELRLRAWEHYFEKDWKKNPDGLGLSEYARMALEQQMSISNGRGR